MSNPQRHASLVTIAIRMKARQTLHINTNERCEQSLCCRPRMHQERHDPMVIFGMCLLFLAHHKGIESHDCSCQLSAYLIETQGHLWLGSKQLCGYRRIRCERRANQLLQVWTVCHHSIQRLRSRGSGASASFGVMCRQMCRDVDPKPPWSRCGSVCQQNVPPKRCRPK